MQEVIEELTDLTVTPWKLLGTIFKFTLQQDYFGFGALELRNHLTLLAMLPTQLTNI